MIDQSVKVAIEEDDKLLYTCVYDGNKVHIRSHLNPLFSSMVAIFIFLTLSLKLLGDLSMAPAV